MRALSFVTLLVSAALAPALVAAQDPPDVGRLFAQEADVTCAGEAPYRMPLTAAVLTAAQPDLSDLRLYDGAGREIPWILDSGGPIASGPGERMAYRTAPALEATHATEGPPRAPTGFQESYVIAPPGEAPPRATWNLVVDAHREAFVGALRVLEIGADGAERELVSTSVYRMRAPTRERLRVAVPGTTTLNLRVELRGENGYLEPLLGWEATRPVRTATTMSVPLEVSERRSEGGVTVLVVRRPPGMLPDRLRFSTTTPAFARVIRIDDTSAYSGEIHRVPTVRDAEALELPVAQLRGATFTITIDDAGSPPLADLSVEAVLTVPSLVFFEPVSLARFAGHRVRPPRYDLDALSGSWMLDRLFDGTVVSEATVGAPRPSPTWDPSPALAFLHRPGVAVTAGDYRFTAPLTVSAAPEGASRFVLSASALSALREDRADLRVVDAEQRQWPYLVTDEATASMPLTVSAGEREGDETRYALGLPVERASFRELSLVADAELVARSVRVLGIDARGDEVAVGEGMLSHSPGQTDPMVVPLGATRVSALTLVVIDGDEAPLAFSSVAGTYATSELFLVAPPGAYTALLGAEQASPPAYDIERARDLLVAIPVADASLGEVAPNGAFHEPSVLEAAGMQTVALWVVLVLAVLVLGVLTLRASREPDPTPTAKVEEPTSAEPGGGVEPESKASKRDESAG